MADKPRAHLASTEEAQDVDRLQRIIVPPGAYVDPNDPQAANASVNRTIEDHPTDLAADYGKRPVSAAVTTGEGNATLPEDRNKWKKADWVNQAKQYGLPVSGNMDEVIGRVNDYEKAIEDAKSMDADGWIEEIEDVDNTDDLGALRKLYDASGADFSTVVEAFDAKTAELSGSES